MLSRLKYGKLNPMALLEVSGLSMAYAEKTLYEDADLELQAGEHMGIVGQNGAGKSTLIRILTGKFCPYQVELIGPKTWKLVIWTSMRKFQRGWL